MAILVMLLIHATDFPKNVFVFHYCFFIRIAFSGQFKRNSFWPMPKNSHFIAIIIIKHKNKSKI